MSGYAGILPPASPSRGMAYAGVLQQMMQNEQAGQAATEKMYRDGFLQRWAMLNPEEQQDAFQHLGPREKQILIAMGQMSVQRPMSSADLIEKQKRADLAGGNSSAAAQPPMDEAGRFSPSAAIMRPGGGVPASQPSPVDRAALLNRQNRYLTGADAQKDIIDAALTMYAQGPEGYRRANAVANKTALSAQERQLADENTRDYSTIKLPEATATIAKTNAETAFKAGPETAAHYASAAASRASAGKSAAETGKIGEETRSLQRTNAQNATYKQTASGPKGERWGSNDGGVTWYDVATGQLVYGGGR